MIYRSSAEAHKVSDSFALEDDELVATVAKVEKEEEVEEENEEEGVSEINADVLVETESNLENKKHFQLKMMKTKMNLN